MELAAPEPSGHQKQKTSSDFHGCFQLSTQDRAAFPDAPAVDECHPVPSGHHHLQPVSFG